MKITKFFALLCAAASLSIAGCEPIDDNTNGNGNGNENTGGENNGGNNGGDNTESTLVLSAKQTVVTGEAIVFTVLENDVDVTNELDENGNKRAKIFNKADYKEVSNPYMPEKDGTYEFYAVYGTNISKTIGVKVVPAIPNLPEDSEPDNLSFNHRVLLVDHTGTKCGYCPVMMAAIKEVVNNNAYHDKFYEAMSHSYNSDDPAWSRAAEVIKMHYHSLIEGYPTATFNFYHPIPAGYYASDIKSQIDALWKAEGADVGVTAAAAGGNTVVVVKAGVKAKVTGDYSITAWLLEDNIYAPQAGTTNEEFYTHNNAVRNIASSEPITGFSLGTIEAGKSTTYDMTMDIVSSDWKGENMKVLVIVSALNESKRYEIANMAICPVNGSVGYDYKR